MPNRHANTGDYRYGFQGQEMDDEIKGEGNSLNYTFRMHDPRVGRFFATDPLEFKFPFYSPYQFSSNTPIVAIELEGLESSDILNEIEKENQLEEEKLKRLKNPFKALIDNFFGSDNRDFNFPGIDVNDVESSQKEINKWMNKNELAGQQVEKSTEATEIFAKGLVYGTGAIILAPIAIYYGAPIIAEYGIGSLSGEVILTKMVASAGGQYVITGRVDGVDVLADGLLINGAGEVIGAFADYDIETGKFTAYGFGNDPKTGKDFLIDLGINAAGGFVKGKNNSLIEKTDFSTVSKMIYEGTMGIVYKASETAVSEEKKQENSKTQNEK